jgi:hypothetical protein
MFTTLLLTARQAVASLTIPFPPTSTNPASTSYTNIIENVSCPAIGTNILGATTTVTSYTVVTTTICPCVSPSTMMTLTQTSTTTFSLSTTIPSQATTTSASGGSGGGPPLSGNIPYANPADFSPYYPCIPGTFLCTEDSTFWTCDITVSWSWTWQYPRQVADDMACIPSLSPGIGDGQMPGAPAGYYRSDQYGRARPLGSCSLDGSVECVGGGSQWAMCDHGGWVNMGPVAPGTVCINGDFVLA